MDKWQNIDAGPRQLKDMQAALSDLSREGGTHDEVTGVIGGAEHTTTLWSPFGGVRPEVAALDEAIRAKHAYKVTKANVRQIIADYAEATAEAAKSRPVVDNRRTADEDAETRARIAARDAADNAKRDAEQALMAQVMAKAPHGAQALIYAELHEDTSDPMSDYSGSRTVRTVAIGFRHSSREDFRALRAAAGQFPETAHLACDEAFRASLGDGEAWRARTSIEHRDNYSMGAGNYLSDHGSANAGTGWVVRARKFPCTYVHLTEDAIPDAAQWAADYSERCQAAARERDHVGPRGGVTVSPSSLGREGVIEIRFADKPPAEVRDALKAEGFRWHGISRCWYGPDTEYAQSLASA